MSYTNLSLRLAPLMALLLGSAALFVSSPGYAVLGDLFRIGVPVEVIRAPLHPAPSQLRKVVVLDFSGDDRTELASMLRERLREAQIMGIQVYSLSDGALTAASSTNLAEVLAGARAQEIDAVYLGDTTMETETSSRFTETVCTKGGGFKKCKEKEDVRCRNYTGSYRALVRVLDVENDEIVYEQRHSNEETERHCSHDKTELPNPKQFAEDSRDAVLALIVADLIPRTEEERIKVKNADKAIAKAHRAQFKEAAAFVRKGRFDKGCGHWNNLYEHVDDSGQAANQSSVALLFNLGLCSEYQRDYELANEYYVAADGLSSRGDRRVTAALDRMRQAERAIELLR